MPLRRPKIVAHRGLHAALPENSHAAMQAAWATGVQWAECDVHESHGRLLVLHDDTLDRTTDRTGFVADLPLDRVDGVRLRDRDGRQTDHPLPQLQDLVRSMPAGGRLMLEIKSVVDYAGFVRTVSGHDVEVQSFEPDDLLRVARLDRTIPLAILVETVETLTASLGMTYDAVHLDHALLDADVAGRLRAVGKKIGAWTVNAEADLRRVLSVGIEVLITDEPALARQVVDEMCGPG